MVVYATAQTSRSPPWLPLAKLGPSTFQPAVPSPLSPLASPSNHQLELTRHHRRNNHHLCLLEHYADTATFVLGTGLVRRCAAVVCSSRNAQVVE